METVYQIFHDFLSSPNPAASTSTWVGWNSPRATEILIEFIAMLFMRETEREIG